MWTTLADRQSFSTIIRIEDHGIMPSLTNTTKTHTYAQIYKESEHYTDTLLFNALLIQVEEKKTKH